MDENRVLTFQGPGEVVLEDRPTPQPEDGEVLIETRRSVVSTGTELTILSGEFPEDSRWARYGTYPFDAGYCNVGTVVEVGANVDTDLVGETVASRASHAAYHVRGADDVIPVPEIPVDEAAFFTLAGIAMNGVRRGRVEWGEAVAVYGCGLIGQLALRACRWAGARPVVGFDLADERLAYLPDDPAVIGVDPETEDPATVFRGVNHDRLADAVFEVTGRGSVIPDEFDVLAEPLGRLVVLSSPRGPTTIDLHDYCNSPSYEIIGAHDGSHPSHPTAHNPWTRRRHYELFFDLVADGAIDVSSLISHRIPSSDAPAVYESLLEDRSEAMGVVIEWE